MPSFADALTEAERWALAYYALSLSAFRDPLTGEPLALDAGTRALLDGADIGRDIERAHDPTRPAPRGAAPADRHRYRFGLLGGPKE